MYTFIPIFIILLVLHVILGLLLDLGTNIVVFLANLTFIFACRVYKKRFSKEVFIMFISGYILLFLFFFGIGNSPLLFSIYVFLYSALFRLSKILGYFLIFIFSHFFLPLYALELFFLLALIYSLFLLILPTLKGIFLKLCFIAGIIFLVFQFFPVFHFLFLTEPQTLLVSLKVKDFQVALFNSFFTATISTILILLFGVPLAYWLSRTEFKGKDTIMTFIDLPIVIPHTTVGICILGLLGPKAFLGDFIYKKFNLSISSSYLGIIICQVFVSFPFLVKSCINTFISADIERLENVSRTLGGSDFFTFWHITLPLSFRSIFSGSIISWARALSESGSLMVLAYYPFTISNYTYDVFTQFGLEETRPFIVILIIACVWSFATLQYFTKEKKSWII